MPPGGLLLSLPELSQKHEQHHLPISFLISSNSLLSELLRIAKIAKGGREKKTLPLGKWAMGVYLHLGKNRTEALKKST